MKKLIILFIIPILFLSFSSYSNSEDLEQCPLVLPSITSGEYSKVFSGNAFNKRLNEILLSQQLNEINSETLYNSYLILAIEGLNGMVEQNTGLPYDVVRVGEGNELIPVDKKVSGLEIGLQILNLVIQRDLEIMTDDQVLLKMDIVLNSIDKAAKKNGFLYDFVSLPSLNKHKLSNVSDVFNSGYLAAALMIANQAFEGTVVSDRCQLILDEMDFNFFYSNNGQLYGDSNKGYSVGQFGSEVLLPAIVATSTDNVPDSVIAPSDSISIYRETYTTNEGEEISVIPAWGGQIWTILMPLLFLGPEVENPDTGENVIAGFIENARRWVEIQIDVADKLDLNIWGWSPCAAVSSKYIYDSENGVPGLEQYGNAGNPRNNPVAIYVSFLALGVLSGYDVASPQIQATLENLEAMISLNPDVNNSNYGFLDSITQDGEVSPFILGLDKGMEVIGMFNAYRRSSGNQGIEGYFWQYLEENGMTDTVRELLGQRSKEILTTIGVENM
ncbi:MAG: hypothetical protein P9X27_04325 [Candidatus Kaelpia aquatica]|nr:hypothetical protein [Candidatus Kaelpia aquatica]